MSGAQIDFYSCTVDGLVAYMAVVKGTGKTWLYHVLTGQAMPYVSKEAAEATLAEGVTVDSVDQVPSHFAVPFGGIVVASITEDVAVAKALGARLPRGGGVQNIANVTGAASVLQLGNVKGDIVLP